ncbi:MAG: flavin reductase family protein, partial [Gammaproteobacteria bacterium]|nr:flavin reductase family protein [Gammaproteobacteria bacterium]
RMIPYGIYVMTAESSDGKVAAATVNWATQASFSPPLVVIGVKADSAAHDITKATGTFALNILGKGQGDIAYTFFKSAERDGNTVSGQPFSKGSATGAPILDATTAFLECKLVDTIEKGDHSVFVGEVVEAGIKKPFEGRADQAVLAMADLGEKVFYGG